MSSKDDWIVALREIDPSELAESIAKDYLEEFSDEYELFDTSSGLFFSGQSPRDTVRRYKFSNVRLNPITALSAILVLYGSTAGGFIALCSIIVAAHQIKTSFSQEVMGTAAEVINALHDEYSSEGKSTGAVFSIKDVRRLSGLSHLEPVSIEEALWKLRDIGWIDSWKDEHSGKFMLVDEVVWSRGRR